MKVLITGSQGQLGKELLKNMPHDIEVIPSDRKTFNLLDLKNCREFIFDNKPDWIINAAAYTAVDLAEDEEDRALLINSEAPTEIAEALKKSGYQTGAFGKWELGSPGSEGAPENQGFDRFYGAAYSVQCEKRNIESRTLI